MPAMLNHVIARNETLPRFLHSVTYSHDDRMPDSLGLIVFDEPRRAEPVVPRERIRKNGKTAELDLHQRRSFGRSTLPEALRIDDW